MANFRTFEDVAAWVAEHSVDELRDLIASPSRTHPENRQMAAAWLRRQIEEGIVAREDEQHEFMRRQTIAAEDSATSARESARAARDAIRWAGWGAAISLAMLIATAWPYFKLLDVLSRYVSR